MTYEEREKMAAVVAIHIAATLSYTDLLDTAMRYETMNLMAIPERSLKAVYDLVVEAEPVAA